MDVNSPDPGGSSPPAFAAEAPGTARLQRRGVPVAWADVERAMLAHRAELERQGSVRVVSIRGGLTHCVLRFRTGPKGHRVHRALRLGWDPQVIAQVRHRLATWQSPRDPGRSPDARMRATWATLKRIAAGLSKEQRGRFLGQVRPLVGDANALLTALGRLHELRSARGQRRPRRDRQRPRLTWMTPAET